MRTEEVKIMDQSVKEDFRINFFFAVKHLNNGKIDSHLYFFRGFCAELNPDYCLLLDIGTEAKPQSINRLVHYMDAYPKVGGSCGEIAVDLELLKGRKTIITFAQYYEYKLSHYLDKAFEGCFSYQSVLPGAFSVFRWEAIKGKPIEEFLKGLNKHELDLLQLNMFLAEDRIMCFQIIIQKGL